MKKILAVILLALSAYPALGEQYEAPALNMVVPSGLEQNQLYFGFQHKFYQSFRGYPADDIFALLNNGANMNITLRYLIFAGLEINTGYSSRDREKIIGLSYVQKFPDWFFNAQAGIQFFSYEDYVHDNTDQNFFYTLCLQSVPLLDERLIVSLDAAFDGYNGTFGLAVGAGFEVIKGLSIILEYFPVMNSGDEEEMSFLGAFGAYSFGVRYQTFGHQFILKFGNTPEIGMRRMMLGSDTLDVYAGFEIMRLVAF